MECQSPAHKKLRVTGDLQDSCGVGTGDVAAWRPPAHDSSSAPPSLSVMDQEALAAANIVAALSANEAKEARARAKATAAAAVKAAARAKAALDAAYRAGREEARWRIEASKNFPAVTSPPAVQVTAPMQSTGVSSFEKTKLENLGTVVGCDDHLARIQATEEQSARLLDVVTGAPKSPRSCVASHKRKAEAAWVPSSPFVASQHGSLHDAMQQQQRPQIEKSSEATHYAPLTSAHDVADVEHGLSAGPVIGSEGVVPSASPASILDGATSLGTPRSSALSMPPDVIVGISEKDVVSNGSCSSILPGNNSLEFSEAPVSGNDLVVFHGGELGPEGFDSLPCPITASSITSTLEIVGKLSNHADSMDVNTFSGGSVETSMDDDHVGCEKEAKFCNGFVTIKRDPAPFAISAENALVDEKTRDGAIKRVALAKPVDAPGPAVVTHLGLPLEGTVCSEHQNGTKLALQQDQHVLDDSALFADNSFTEKNQKPVVHMSVSNHGEKLIPCSSTKASVSTACSAPLQTTALTGVPSGQHS